MAEKLSVRVVLEMAERVLAPLKRIQSGSSDAANALKAASDKLKELNKAERDVAGYRQTRVALRQQTAQLQAVQAKSTQYSAALEEQRTRHINITASLRSAKHAYNQITNAYQDGKIQGAEYTRQIELARITLLSSQQAHERSLASINKYKAQVKNAGERVAGLTQSIKGGTERLAGYKTRLDAAGIDTARLGVQSRTLKGNIEASTASIERQKEALRALGEQQKKLAALKEKHAKAMMHTGMAAGAGMAMKAAGTRGVQIGMGPVGDYASHQTHMLGIAKQVEGARDPKTGKLGPAYYELEAQIRAMSTQVPMLTNDITDMFTAGARMEVPKDKLKDFVRLASDMASAFEAPPAELAESMGKIGKNFKIPVEDMRGMADAINYLDDNAISKGADIIDLLNRIGGIAGSVKISGSDMAALGSTLLTLGDTSETASTGIKTIFTRMAAATKMSKKFRGAIAEVGLRPEDVQAGMAENAVGTLLKLSEAIKKLPEKDRMGVMAEIAGVEHVGRLAKLVGNTEELRRQIALANGEDAKGSMAREAAARNETLQARWQMLKNGAFNLSAVVGETLQPALLSLMEAVTPLIEGFARWVKENPALVGGVMKLAIGGSALVAALGAVLLPLALIAGKAMMVRFLFARMALMFASTGAATGAAAGGMGLMARAGFMLGRLFGGILRTLGLVGRINPWAALVVFATVAFASISERWAELKSYFSAGEWSKFWGVMWEVFESTLDKATLGFYGFIKGLLAAGKSALGFGGDEERGAAVRKAAARASLAAGAAGAIAISPAAQALQTGQVNLQRPQPLAPMAQRAAAAPVVNNNTITVHAAPGMDERATARAVAQELDRRERQAGVRARSAMRDD